MLFGKLANAVLIANVLTKLYTVAERSKFLALDIFVLNASMNTANLKIAISTSEVPELKDFIEFNSILEPSEVLERINIKCSEGEKIFVLSTQEDTIVRLAGYEGDLS